MNPFEMTLGLCFAAILVGIAMYFAWRQWGTLRNLHQDRKATLVQRHFLIRQCQRRLFGSILLIVLAALLAGSVFLDFNPLQTAINDMPPAEREAAKQTVRFLSVYVMSMLLVLLVMLVIAVLDFWATARFGMQQQKQLAQEHHEMLEAELAELRHRQAEMN